MGGNRLIIRLIDVAFIILFGFIGISGLKTEHIELPTGSDPTKNPEKFQELSLRVYPHEYEVMNGGRRKRYADLDDLEQALLQYQAGATKRHEKLMVKIQSSQRAIMQNLIDVIDVCQKNKIQKNLEYGVFK